MTGSYSPLDGAIPENRLPVQNTELIMLTSDRYERSSMAHEDWAGTAKTCFDFVEDKQWDPGQKSIVEDVEGRPALTLNKIKPLVFLALGYHLQNRTQWKHLPGNDDSATFEIATSLNKIVQNIGEASRMPFIDAEVFLDGLIGGRGYYDTRLNFENNILGDVKVTACDPFSVKLDPDGNTYDLNESCGYVITDRWLSLDEIELTYGREAAANIAPLLHASGNTGMPGNYFDIPAEAVPIRRFGGEAAEPTSFSGQLFERFSSYIDRSRKVVRLIDMQHYKNTQAYFFVDLESGQREMIPDKWLKSPAGRMKIEKIMAFAASRGEAIRILKMMTRRVRWTQMAADTILYDDWSPHEQFTITGFFPYFRRGVTKGMVESLIDPQREHNKRRSARLNIIMRAAHSGWIYDKDSLDVTQEENLKRFGSSAGVHIKYNSKGGTLPPPKQIEPPTSPEAMRQLEREAEDDLKQISGINDSALGQLDVGQSGRAIEARQRQTVVGLEVFLQNYKRSKELLGYAVLWNVQKHYTEERVYKVIGEDGKPERLVINQATANAIVSNIQIGDYRILIDESPVSASFMEAQFAEALMLREKGVPIPDDVLIELSSLGMKDVIKQRVDAVRAQMGMAPTAGAASGGAPPTAAPPGVTGGADPMAGQVPVPGAQPAAVAAPSPAQPVPAAPGQIVEQPVMA